MASNSELLDLYSALRRGLSLEASSYLREVGFSLRQFLIIRSIGLNGEMAMTEIAGTCMTDAATISRSITQLLKDGYVKRGQSEKDARVFKVALTAKGKKLMPELQRIHNLMGDHCFAVLSDAENDVLAKLLTKVVHSLQAKRLQRQSHASA